MTAPLDDRVVPPRWAWLAGVVLSVVGLGVAGYLTYEHYTGSTTLSCPAGGGAVNCFKVTTSVYNQIHGVPVAVLGLVFFFVMLILQTPVVWRWPNRMARAAQIAWCVIGLATALKLVYDELYKIDAICLWCTSVHVITFLIFVATVMGTAATSAPAYDPDD
ncbi:MAG TPA: vitamin K epoxide reductase family protein [Acidimicrobiales bacterium]|jgi:uncharacterized membrane protein|nr:vitamin K epoxide reductase family protein [Acidimicrobiales bacterium]